MANFISSYTGEQINEAIRRALSFEQSSIASVKLPSTELIPYSLNSLPASGSYMIEYVTNGPVDLVGIKPVYIQGYTDTTNRYQMITMGNKTYLRSGLISSGENITWSEWANYRFVTDAEKATWNGKSNFSGNYNDLTSKPTILTSTNQLINNSGFITINDVPNEITVGVIKPTDGSMWYEVI